MSCGTDLIRTGVGDGIVFSVLGFFKKGAQKGFDSTEQGTLFSERCDGRELVMYSSYSLSESKMLDFIICALTVVL